jgi:hypothetical protein
LRIRLIWGNEQIVSCGKDDWAIRFNAPGDCLPRYRAECTRGKRQRVSRVFSEEPHHLSHLNDDLGERKATLLVRRDFRFHGKAQRIYECKQSVISRGD